MRSELMQSNEPAAKAFIPLAGNDTNTCPDPEIKIVLYQFGDDPQLAR